MRVRLRITFHPRVLKNLFVFPIRLRQQISNLRFQIRHHVRPVRIRILFNRKTDIRILRIKCPDIVRSRLDLFRIECDILVSLINNAVIALLDQIVSCFGSGILLSLKHPQNFICLFSRRRFLNAQEKCANILPGPDRLILVRTEKCSADIHVQPCFIHVKNGKIGIRPVIHNQRFPRLVNHFGFSEPLLELQSSRLFFEFALARRPFIVYSMENARWYTPGVLAPGAVPFGFFFIEIKNSDTVLFFLFKSRLQNLRFVAPQLRRQMRYEMARINQDFASLFPVIIHDRPELLSFKRQRSKDQIERTSPVQTQSGLDKFQPVQLLLPLELLLRSVSFQPCAL